MYGMHHSSIGQDFMTFGTQSIDVHHAIQTRIDQAQKHSIISNTRDKSQPMTMRHHLGGMMISLGTLIAGTTAHIQERQATRPSPDPKSGFIPTR